MVKKKKEKRKKKTSQKKKKIVINHVYDYYSKVLYIGNVSSENIVLLENKKFIMTIKFYINN